MAMNKVNEMPEGKMTEAAGSGEMPEGKMTEAAGDEQRYTERDFPIELIYTLCKKIWISNRFVKSEEIEQ